MEVKKERKKKKSPNRNVKKSNNFGMLLKKL